ncbi:MAG: hypothetical protein M4579_003711 [Chaenotheca gracillima]|nr:MAG: hypothetical protein M4579_003711 [Chaenotheca gracillima]
MADLSRPMPSAAPERLADKLEAPALDDRSYRVIRLSNKIEALIVHDADTDKASAALDVNVGNFSDRDDMPGMAHAVEHLSFMGTEKYPVENAYSQYLAAHSGYSNAYTAATSTNYFFEVSALPGSGNEAPSYKTSEGESSPLYGALDRFAQFFIAPLFLSETLDRELRAVDSENKKNLQSDTWRLNQLAKSLSNPDHPYCHFSTGNLETLRDNPKQRGIEVRSEFIAFHEQHYSANRMKLVVLGREPLDELESWVTEMFSEVRNKELPQNRWDGLSPLTSNELLTRFFAKPVMDHRSLEITFPFLDEENLYETQPSRYLSHLIGHEGPGSILAYVKAKGWANELSAGSSPVCPGSALFTILVTLTEEGFKKYEEILKVIFQYISLIRETPPQEWIFDEMKGMAEVDFRFRQKAPASMFTSRTSSVMQRPYPREWLLSGTSLIRKYDPQLIRRALGYLKPDNFRYALISPDFSEGLLDKNERWYGTQYKNEKIPSALLEQLEQAGHSTNAERLPELHLPHKNEFIPTRLEVEKKEVKQPTKSPKLIRNDDAARLWWKKDDQFWVPKANVYITLRNPAVYTTPQHVVKTKLYCELVRDGLAEYSYDAELAGLGYALSYHSVGLDVEVAGYNDRMAVLLEKVLVQMRDLEIKPDRFKVVKERLLRRHRNWDFQQPYYQVGEFTKWLNTENGWINEQLVTELPHVTAEDIRKFYPQLLGQVHVEMLAHGNLYKEDALKLMQLVESTLRARPLPQSQWNIRRSLILPKGCNFIYPRTLQDPANVNHCIEYFVYIGDQADRSLRAKLLLFAQTTDEPAFDQLRTKEQLGYVVFSGSRMTSTAMGYRVLIQSERSTEYLEKRIDAFLIQFGQTLKAMTQEEFEGHKRSLINKRLEKLKHLNLETGRFWKHIASEYMDFEQVDHDASHISQISKSDLEDFFAEYIAPSSSVRSKVSVHMLAQGSAAEKAAKTDPSEQKTKFLGLISQYLESSGLVVDSEQLQDRFKEVDVSGGDQDSILSAIGKHLSEDVKLGAEQTKMVLGEGAKILAAVLPSLGIQVRSQTDESTVESEQSVSAEMSQIKAPTIIEDVHQFKARLPVSTGAMPVTPLSEFEDSEPKL